MRRTRRGRRAWRIARQALTCRLRCESLGAVRRWAHVSGGQRRGCPTGARRRARTAHTCAAAPLPEPSASERTHTGQSVSGTARRRGAASSWGNARLRRCPECRSLRRAVARPAEQRRCPHGSSGSALPRGRTAGTASAVKAQAFGASRKTAPGQLAGLDVGERMRSMPRRGPGPVPLGDLARPATCGTLPGTAQAIG